MSLLGLREFHSFEAAGRRFVYLVPSAAVFALAIALQLQPRPASQPDAPPLAEVSAAYDADTAVAARGRSTTIDVLANDRATNPFPGTPLRVVGVRGLDDSLPDGVTIEPSDDRSALTVEVAEHAAPVNTTLRYQVADATGDPSRYAWGTVTISVQDRPDPVTGPHVTGFGDGRAPIRACGDCAAGSPWCRQCGRTGLAATATHRLNSRASTRVACSHPTPIAARNRNQRSNAIP